MQKKGYVTVSVDDGHVMDLKTADLCSKYGLKATFYIPAHNPERELLEKHHIRDLSKAFEIGSHTLNHRRLDHLAIDHARLEIIKGKQWLEDLIGKRTFSFCYPQGKYNSTTVQLVKEAGFLGARTCMFNLSHIPRNPYLWGVSTHGYSHSAHVQIRHALLECNFLGVCNYVFIHRLAQDWAKHFERAVHFVNQHGGVAHIYLHSWEIDQQNHWDKLESVLKSLAKISTLQRVTNGDLFSLSHVQKEPH